MNELIPLDQLAVEIRFYSQQTAQNIIEVGKRLIEAKKQVSHGEWGDWLEKKVSFTERHAQRFMKCAERFSNTTLMSDLNPTQMIALLSLPEPETQDFIEAKAAEGKPVEDMTIKTLRQEIKDWKTKAEQAGNEAFAAVNDRRRAELRAEQVERSNETLRNKCNAQAQQIQYLQEDCETLKQANKELADREPTVVEITPEDYEGTKQENESVKGQNRILRSKIEGLQRKNDELQKEVNTAKAHSEGKTYHEWAEEHGIADATEIYEEMTKKANVFAKYIEHYADLPQGVELREYVRCFVNTTHPDHSIGISRIRIQLGVALNTLHQIEEIIGDGRSTKPEIKVVK